jgi:UPF0271 protein
VRIDLNADVGESVGDDAGLMTAITSANIAAGLHAGNPTVLRETVRLAGRAGVAIGAHPGFNDRANFGRRDIRLTPKEAEDLVLYQIAVVAGVAAAEGFILHHVKPHGALYNMAARDAELAGAIARAAAVFDPALVLVGPPASELLRQGRAAGLRVAAEVFADRAYEPDGSLVSRDRPGAIVHDLDAVLSRAVTMVKDGYVVASDGRRLPLEADTICLHGDTPGATEIARALRVRLESAGVQVKSLAAV